MPLILFNMDSSWPTRGVGTSSRYCHIHVDFVKEVRNSTCTSVFIFLCLFASLSPPLPWLHSIFVVTLPSPVLAGCLDCWLARWHMPGGGAKHRVSLQLEPRLSVVLVAFWKLSVHCSSPYLRLSHCPSCLHPLFETLVLG